jgi:L-2-hydroxyglutarate oxidase LhgO
MADVVVIGAGIVGLATALKILERGGGAEVVVVEKEDDVGTHQTGHNSGVIHAGLYYRPGSLKARTCRRGIELLLRFCDEHDVPYELCGKVVVATSAEEEARLEELHQRGVANGVPDLAVVGPDRLRELEPHAAGRKALVSPSTGIIDFDQVARAYARVFEERGGVMRLNCAVRGVALARGEVVLETSRGPILTKKVVSCAGLEADRIARLAGPARLVDPEGNDAGPAPDVRIIPFRGEYYSLRSPARSLVRNLIYPVPDPRFPFLGAHFTRSIAGSIEAGPNAVLALAREGYRRSDVKLSDAWEALGWAPFWRLARQYWRTGFGEIARSLSRELFARALQRLVPDVRAEDLDPGGAGVRAQALSADGRLLDDFVITRTERFVNVLNAPSPAATAALAIGERVAAIVTGGTSPDSSRRP